VGYVPINVGMKCGPAMSKFSAKDYNYVAKRFRENFPDDPDNTPDVLLKRHMLVVLMLDFAEGYLKDNPRFDPLKFLDVCSPNADLYPLSELWEDYIA
jgi:hypothetical protein